MTRDASTLADAAGGTLDLAVTLGSGLFDALADSFAFTPIAYDLLLGMPIAPIAGHGNEALVGVWHGKHVAAFCGRVHLYQGFSAQQVTVSVRLAHAAGAQTLIVTNAAGAINPEFASGDLMLIDDHLNLTGENPLLAAQSGDLFVSMEDAYSKRLRDIAHACATPAERLRHGVYAGLLGPTYETLAESRYLHTIGADAVGMSTVLETISARARKMEVLGLSVITNAAGSATTHDEVTATGKEAGQRLAALLDRVVAKL